VHEVFVFLCIILSVCDYFLALSLTLFGLYPYDYDVF
jgi:hypothetical protein